MSGNEANRGKAFEEQLDGMHRHYNTQGRASVIRTPPAVKPLAGVQHLTYRLGSGPRARTLSGYAFPATWAAEGPPDYLAEAFGCSLMFDAKSGAGDSWKLERLEPHQADRFTAHERHGEIEVFGLRVRTAFAFVLVQLGADVFKPRTYLLPWRELGPVWRAWSTRTGRAAPGTSSIKPAAIPWALPVQGADWLPVARSLFVDPDPVAAAAGPRHPPPARVAR